jgi:uncharacterized repeat protein (TIGR01451 family)
MVDPGELLTYTLSLTYTAVLTPASNVILTDAIPANVTFLDATAPYSLIDGAVHWSFPNLEALESRNVLLTVQVPSTASGLILNQAYGAYGVGLPYTPGQLVSTPIIRFQLYLPFNWKNVDISGG